MKARSQKYQYLFQEILVEPSSEQLANKNSQDSVQMREIKLDISERLIQIANDILTEKQRDIFNYYFVKGLTQTDIAKKMKINQSSVTKSINGNFEYSDGGRMCYGGSLKKIRRAAEKDDLIIKLYQKLDEIKELQHELSESESESES